MQCWYSGHYIGSIRAKSWEFLGILLRKAGWSQEAWESGMLKWICDVSSAQPSLIKLARRHGNQCTTFINTPKNALVQEAPVSLRNSVGAFLHCRRRWEMKSGRGRCLNQQKQGVYHYPVGHRDRMETRRCDRQGFELLDSWSCLSRLKLLRSVAEKINI